MRKMVFLWICGFFFLRTQTGLFPQNSFSRGEELFLANRPQEAVSFLETAFAEDPAHVKAALYLGIAYEQLDRSDDAIAALRKILPRAGAQSALIAFNLGNVYFARGEFAFADQYYTQAIQADPSYIPAYLNRANARVKNEALNEAISDYEQYLVLAPGSQKRGQIEALIQFIREEFRIEEEKRIAAEAEVRAAAERRQRILEEVSASLQASAEETQSLSAGTEDVQDYDGEFELE